MNSKGLKITLEQPRNKSHVYVRAKWSNMQMTAKQDYKSKMKSTTTARNTKAAQSFVGLKETRFYY